MLWICMVFKKILYHEKNWTKYKIVEENIVIQLIVKQEE